MDIYFANGGYAEIFQISARHMMKAEEQQRRLAKSLDDIGIGFANCPTTYSSVTTGGYTEYQMPVSESDVIAMKRQVQDSVRAVMANAAKETASAQIFAFTR